MTLDAWNLAATTAQWVTLAGIALHQVFIARSAVRRAQLKRFEDDLHRLSQEYSNRIGSIEQRVKGLGPCGEHRERVRLLEQRLDHAPNAGDIEKLYNRINPLSTEISAMHAEITALHESLTYIRHGLTELTNALLTRERT